MKHDIIEAVHVHVVIEAVHVHDVIVAVHVHDVIEAVHVKENVLLCGTVHFLESHTLTCLNRFFPQ